MFWACYKALSMFDTAGHCVLSHTAEASMLNLKVDEQRFQRLATQKQYGVVKAPESDNVTLRKNQSAKCESVHVI